MKIEINYIPTTERVMINALLIGWLTTCFGQVKKPEFRYF